MIEQRTSRSVRLSDHILAGIPASNGRSTLDEVIAGSDSHADHDRAGRPVEAMLRLARMRLRKVRFRRRTIVQQRIIDRLIALLEPRNRADLLVLAEAVLGPDCKLCFKAASRVLATELGVAVSDKTVAELWRRICAGPVDGHIRIEDAAMRPSDMIGAGPPEHSWEFEWRIALPEVPPVLVEVLQSMLTWLRCEIRAGRERVDSRASRRSKADVRKAAARLAGDLAASDQSGP